MRQDKSSLQVHDEQEDNEVSNARNNCMQYKETDTEEHIEAYEEK